MESELSDSRIGFRFPVVLVMNRQRVVLVDRVIQPWADIGASLRISDGFAKRSGIQIWIKNNCVDGGQVVDVPPLRAEEKRRCSC